MSAPSTESTIAEIEGQLLTLNGQPQHDRATLQTFIRAKAIRFPTVEIPPLVSKSFAIPQMLSPSHTKHKNALSSTLVRIMISVFTYIYSYLLHIISAGSFKSIIKPPYKSPPQKKPCKVLDMQWKFSEPSISVLYPNDAISTFDLVPYRQEQQIGQNSVVQPCWKKTCMRTNHGQNSVVSIAWRPNPFTKSLSEKNQGSINSYLAVASCSDLSIWMVQENAQLSNSRPSEKMTTLLKEGLPTPFLLDRKPYSKLSWTGNGLFLSAVSKSTIYIYSFKDFHLLPTTVIFCEGPNNKSQTMHFPNAFRMGDQGRPKIVKVVQLPSLFTQFTITDMQYSPDGDYLAVGVPGAFILYETKTWKSSWTLLPGRNTILSWGHLYTRTLLVGFESTIQVVRISRNAPTLSYVFTQSIMLSTFRPPNSSKFTGPLRQLSWSYDCKRLAILSETSDFVLFLATNPGRPTHGIYGHHIHPIFTYQKVGFVTSPFPNAKKPIHIQMGNHSAQNTPPNVSSLVSIVWEGPKIDLLQVIPLYYSSK